jgi:hypothetical protein
VLEQGILDDERLARALAERYGIDRLELDHFPVDPAAAALVGVDAALRHEALPVAQLDGGRLLVAIADPGGGPGASAVAAATGREVVPAVAPRHRLRALIEATASRTAVPWPEPPVAEPAPADEPEPAGDHRAAELERELAEARGRLDAAEERLAAARSACWSSRPISSAPPRRSPPCATPSRSPAEQRRDGHPLGAPAQLSASASARRRTARRRASKSSPTLRSLATAPAAPAARARASMSALSSAV